MGRRLVEGQGALGGRYIRGSPRRPRARPDNSTKNAFSIRILRFFRTIWSENDRHGRLQMLLRFSAGNFRSILDPQELSFVSTPLKDRSDGLIPCGAAATGTLLPAAVIYGANASGKSNVVRALLFMANAVTKSHSLGAPEGGVPCKHFALDSAARTWPSSFDADFIIDNVRYHYSFTNNSKVFLTERLYAFPNNRRQMLYERSEPKDITFGRSLKGRKQSNRRSDAA